MVNVVIVDADPIIYAAGFAAQSSTYEYVLEDEKGNLSQHGWQSGNEALKFIRENKMKIVEKTVHIEPKEVGFARQAAKTQLESIIKQCRSELDDANAAVEIYLSGPGNFRYQIATIAQYKADRPPPPIHYQALRDYLTQRWHAVVVSGMEADDKVSIRCREVAADGSRCVLATIDKDLDQVPCLHYNYQKKVFYVVSEMDADMVFWTQCISGDSTDNIPGCYKIGTAKAEAMIARWMDEKIPKGKTLAAHIWENIIDTFAVNMVQYPERFPKGMKPDEAALETARLVFMQEYEGQLWNPPGVPHAEVSSLAPVRPAGT